MLLMDLASRTREDQKFEVEFDNDVHELTAQEILDDDDYGTQGVIRWFVSKSEPETLVVVCNGNWRDLDCVTATQAAEMLGVSRMRVNQLLNDGKLDAMKVGGKWMVERESVLERLEQK